MQLLQVFRYSFQEDTHSLRFWQHPTIRRAETTVVELFTFDETLQWLESDECAMPQCWNLNFGLVVGSVI